MASNISNILNNKFRLTGMASGLDTDSMIKQLMKVERYKVDKVKQDKQLLEWKRDDYRSVTTLLTSFKNDFFDVLKPASNMRSTNNYKQYSATSSDSLAITATATSAAVAGTHTITATQLATAANATGGVNATKALESNLDIGNFVFTNQDLNITLNGVTKNIKLDGNYTDIAGLKAGLQSAIDTAFGAAKITVGNNLNKLNFSTANGKITLTSGSIDALAQLNLSTGASNRLNLYDKLNVSNISTTLSGSLAFNINGVNFSFDTTTKTMNDVMTEINSSAANVNLTYSEVTDKFTLTSKTNGAGTAITISDTSGGLFGASSAIGITATAINNGQDAIFNLDVVNGIVRSDNNFTIDGVSYSVNQLNAPATITVNQDVDGVYNKIKTFIDKYNELISKVNGELQEERDKNYQPLTDEQRESMSEDDIKTWEAKAKSGMLRNDGILTNVVDTMRRALYDSIKDVSGGLSTIGITTDSYFLSTKAEKGKLIIDETKLKDAIRNSPDKVMNIFSKESTVAYSPNLTTAERSTRYNENGVVQKIYDILQDNIRTIRDTNGKKGILLEKAGIIGDLTEFNSLIPDEIEKKDSIISDMLDRLYDKEDSYYKKFAALEKAMSQMNSQSSWLTQQFGGGQ